MKRFWINFYSVFLLLLCSDSYAREKFNQIIPFQGEGYEEQGYLREEIEENSPFMIQPESSDEWKGNHSGARKPTPFLFSNDFEANFSDDDKFNVYGTSLPGSFSKDDVYKDHENKKILRNAEEVNQSRVTFSFIKDEFDYENRGDNFEKIYRGSGSSNIYGILLFKNDFYYVTSFVNLFYGVGAGLGYNRGKGVFVEDSPGDNSKYNDRVSFILYTLPIDARLGVEIPLGRYLGISFSGGPSALGLVEHRSDRGHDENDRNKFQFGGGYFGSASLNFSISSILKKTGLKVLSGDRVSRFSANIEIRRHSYFGFEDDDLAISGTSFGAGFSYSFF